MGLLQKLRTVLIPEIGLDLDPEFIQEAEISTDVQRAIAHVACRTGQRSIMIKATSDGRMLVAASGTAMEIYQVEEGAGPDAYNVGSTYETDVANYVTDLLIETFDATVSFRNAAGVWGDDKSLLVGFASFDLIHYGIRVQNRVALSACAYEITLYR